MTARAKKGACFVRAWGTCGDLRYLEEIEDGIHPVFRYYDGSGRLLSTGRGNIEHGGGLVWDGPEQKCARREDGDICKSRK